MDTKCRSKKWCMTTICLIVLLTLGGAWYSGRLTDVLAAAQLSVPGKASADRVNVRKKAGTGEAQLTLSGKKIVLKKNQAVTILSESMVKGEKWYQISFKQDNKSLKGYVHSDYVVLTLKRMVSARIKSTKAVPIITAAGKTKEVLKVKGKAVSLKDGTVCTILKETTVSQKKWFQVKFTLNGESYKGYVESEKLRFQAESAVKTETGTVIATNLNVRAEAGTDKLVIKYKDNAVRLGKGQKVTVLSKKKVDEVNWYQVSFSYQDAKLTGFVSGDYVVLDSEKTPAPAKTPVPTIKPEEPEATKAPTGTPAPGDGATPTPTPLPGEPSAPLSDEEFEQSLNNQGFPEDYKIALRLLHEKYPMWEFRAMHTGLSWNQVIQNEAKVGMNLITNSKAIAWKSMEGGAYNWSSDRFIPFDGSTWVTASKAAVEYYMDPRNFLVPDGIFQFEVLSYNNRYQTLSGIENILSGTSLSGISFTAIDEYGMESSYTYGDTFIKAAEYSGVNPYHLASRVKQEVITSNGVSSSISGTVTGYEGLYNYYNIGANDSTVPGGNIANGLKFARDGKGMSEANKELLLLPWNNPYNSIVGGAKYIGSNYINRGQETVYLQKFNVTPTGTYTHQYMSNVEAAKAEAQKIYTANKNQPDVPVEFLIPVYLDMPAAACAAPSGGENPNNWLASLSIDNAVMTPTFKAADPEGTVYSVLVDSTIEYVTITAKTASKLASAAGAGEIMLNSGSNMVTISVTAQNGSTRNYTIEIIRQES